MRLATALRLGRVAYVPTIASNVLAAVALAGARPAPATLALACFALASMYVAGMFLNDAFDRDHDRAHRPDKPIPAGDAHAAVVVVAGFALLLGGIAAGAVAALAAGAGWKPVVSAVALGSLIVFYDAYHREVRYAPVVMGLCRAGVYTTAALLVRPDLCAPLLVGALLLAAYLAGCAYAARAANLVELENLWPLALIAAPFLVARPHDTFSLAVYTAFLLWAVRGVSLVRARRLPEGIPVLVAGISLLDALACANYGRIELALPAVAAFGLTTLLVRLAPPT